VPARQRGISDGGDNFVSEMDCWIIKPESVFQPGFEAEGADMDAGIEAAHADYGVTQESVVVVYDRRVAVGLVGENLGFHRGVIFEIAVTTEMVGSDVQNGRDPWAERPRGFKLIAANLEYNEVGGGICHNGGGKREVVVPGEQDGAATCVDKVAQELRRSGLTVCAGDGQEARPATGEREFHLSEYVGALCLGGKDRRNRGGYTRAWNDKGCVAKRGVGVPAEFAGHA